MPGLRDLLLGVLLPAILCGLALLLAGRLIEPAARLLAGCAFGAGYLAAHLALAGLPAWPSAGTTPPARDWIAWAVLAASLLACLPERVPATAIRAFLAIGLAWLSLRSWPAIAAVSVLVFSAAASADALNRRSAGPSTALVLLVASIGTSVASLLAHSALIAQLAGAVAACLGASVVVARRDRRFRLPPAGLTVVALALGGGLLNGVFYSDLPVASALLLFGAVVAPTLADLQLFGRPSPWKRVALAVLASALAVWVAWPADAAAP